MKRTVILITVIATLFAACGDDESDDAASAAEPVSVADALAVEGEIVVTGSLFVLDDGRVVLADLVAESFPPQPAGATIPVQGLDLDALDLEEAPAGSELATTKWSAEPITLTGSMVSGTLDGAKQG